MTDKLSHLLGNLFSFHITADLLGRDDPRLEHEHLDMSDTRRLERRRDETPELECDLRRADRTARPA